MTDIVGTARSAREMLARGLNALQADPNAPAEFLSAAEPIAMAMGALHRIERSNGAQLAAAAPEALEHVRGALSLLQAKAGADARFSAVLEEVAGSLGMVFSLNKAASYGPAPAPQPAPVQSAAPYSPPPAAQQPFAAPAQPARPAIQPQPAPAYAPPVQAYAPPVQAYAPPPQAQPQPAHQPAPWQQPQPAPQAAAYPQPVPAHPQHSPAPPQAAPSPQAVPAYAPPQQAFAQQPYAPPQQPQAFAPPQQPQAFAPPQQPQAYAPPAQAQAYAPPPQAAQPVGASGYRDAEKLPLVEAELGTHSVSNFYRGLSGNDVIESGGIFVSTYNIPELGQRLRLRVSLPGGLEFEALGVVRWVREARESMASDISPPGFGLQFTNISAEGRNLVYRYVRNREPMFHDDL